MSVKISALVALLAVAALVVRADYKASCASSSVWAGMNKKLKDSATWSNLSTCQASKLQMKVNDNLIGGKGDAKVIGIPAGSDSKGCSSDSGCMRDCQAMCCLQDRCLSAEIYQKKEVDDYVFYKETAYYYYCRLKMGSIDAKRSERHGFCYKNPGSAAMADCPNLVATSMFKMNITTYQGLLSLQNNNSCTTSGRKLLDASSLGIKTYTRREIKDSLNRVLFRRFASLRKNAMAQIKAKGCSKAKTDLKKRINALKCPAAGK